jgi:MmyB-like transcription regulator ligand binding domain
MGSVQRIVDSMSGTRAHVRNGRLDILYATQLAQALYSDLYRDPARPVNGARSLFLDPCMTGF